MSAGPSVTRDDVLILITLEDGFVHAIDREGNRRWNINCANIQNEDGVSCVNNIQGGHSLSPNGLVFFYSDTFGNVKALQLGTSLVDTVAPSPFPTLPGTPSPTATPTGPIPSSSPTLSPSISVKPTGAMDTMAPTDPRTSLPTASPEQQTPPTPETPSNSDPTGGSNQGSGAIISSVTFALACSIFLPMINY